MAARLPRRHGPIVYLNDFGPLTDPWFALWWDMLLIGVVSLATFYRALHVPLPRERIEALVARGAAIDGEPALATP